MKKLYLFARSPPHMVSALDIAWAVLKADPYADNHRAYRRALGPVYGHLAQRREQARVDAENTPFGSYPLDELMPGEHSRLNTLFAGMDIEPVLMNPPIPSDAQEDREMRETVAGDSPQRRLNRFEERTGRPPSEREPKLKLYNKIFKFEEANELPKNDVSESKPLCESKPRYYFYRKL